VLLGCTTQYGLLEICGRFEESFASVFRVVTVVTNSYLARLRIISSARLWYQCCCTFGVYLTELGYYSTKIMRACVSSVFVLLCASTDLDPHLNV
jgi:hypothetical protein